jgi:hypothetical protein
MEQPKISIDELVQSASWKKFMDKINLYSGIMLAILIIMIILGYTDGKNFRLIAIITLMTMGTSSFFMAFLKFESESAALSKWFYKIYGLGLSFGFINLLFIIQHLKYPIANFFIPLALLLMSISFFLGLREITGENKNKLDWQYFLRLSIGLFPLAYLYIQHKF